MYPLNMLEEELKKRLAKDFFNAFDTTPNLGRVDFAVAENIQNDTFKLFDTQYFLWAEAKRGIKDNLYDALTQLIITIGKERTFNNYLPPFFLGAFNAQAIMFVEYYKVQDIFYLNDFNWNITPSDHQTKEFGMVKTRLEELLKETPFLYDYEKDKMELVKFIKQNFIIDYSETRKVRVTFNNMTHIFNRWLEKVKPTIEVKWDDFEKEGILACDFFLADVLSRNNQTLSDSMKVLLRDDKYTYNMKVPMGGSVMSMFGEIQFSDKQKEHSRFWAKYERPPLKKHREEMCNRRDLLVPPDRRERKGAFFTPYKWVDLSQKYLADVLGENWQEEYYIWDCCAGTGNLLNGLYNKYNIYASTLDDADVRTMQQQANLLSSHVFQFDFLNDDLQGDKVPQSLKEILNNPEKRKKLVIYINPPYAEAGNAKQSVGTGDNKAGTATNNNTYLKYKELIKSASNELFAQFFIRIYKEIGNCVLAEFSKLKILQAPNFSDFRNIFKAKLLKSFAVPANTFDNVKGLFPIGFFIWDMRQEEVFQETNIVIYDSKGVFLQNKNISCTANKNNVIGKWMISYDDKVSSLIGMMNSGRNDFQNTKYNYITNDHISAEITHASILHITHNNIHIAAIYYAVRHVIPATWINDRDQFLYPNDGWKDDKIFQSDCLAYTLFNNNIQSAHGTNHWIPFTEEEVGAKERFESHFMVNYINGKIKPTQTDDLFGSTTSTTEKITFSVAASAVLDAGRDLFRYYHSQKEANPNASYYDIRLFFKGTDAKGKMNNTSNDARFNELDTRLRNSLKTLAREIEPKVYSYGFLKESFVSVNQEDNLFTE